MNENMKFGYWYLRNGWQEWLAFGFILDVQARHVSLRLGKFLFELSKLATTRWSETL